jgi:hypothetical protein
MPAREADGPCSLITEAVRPAALLPLPEVYTATKNTRQSRCEQCQLGMMEIGRELRSVVVRAVPMGATFSTNLRNCDLAVPGSPYTRSKLDGAFAGGGSNAQLKRTRSSTLMSPRSRIPSGRLLRDPQNSRHAMAFLMS